MARAGRARPRHQAVDQRGHIAQRTALRRIGGKANRHRHHQPAHRPACLQHFGRTRPGSPDPDDQRAQPPWACLSLLGLAVAVQTESKTASARPRHEAQQTAQPNHHQRRAPHRHAPRVVQRRAERCSADVIRRMSCHIKSAANRNFWTAAAAAPRSQVKAGKTSSSTLRRATRRAHTFVAELADVSARRVRRLRDGQRAGREQEQPQHLMRFWRAA